MENRHCGVVWRLIVLTTINAKWIHPSLALRLLKANLGSLESECEIIEFALRQPLAEKLEGIIAARPRILGVSVSIWNHTATIELLRALEKIKLSGAMQKPIIVLGGPEVSHLPKDAEIFRYADYVIRGEGEIAFRDLCAKILSDNCFTQRCIESSVDVTAIKPAYYLYTNEDLTRKLVYVESSRGCPFSCEFCLSAVKSAADSKVRKFPLKPFLADMDALIRRGAKTFKFLDRTFNSDIPRALTIMGFFLGKIKEGYNLVVHFEMVPSLFPQELYEMLSRFPPDSLRLEIGIQTLNGEVAARICRPSKPEQELEAISFLRQTTHAIIHVDLIAGLPGEDLESFGRGFDRLWSVLYGKQTSLQTTHVEIQLGILKLLPGAPISRHNKPFGMCYNTCPPYEIEETSAMSAFDLQRIKNFARFWELIVNRYNFPLPFTPPCGIFDKFMALSDSLFTRFGRNWGIDKKELLSFL